MRQHQDSDSQSIGAVWRAQDARGRSDPLLASRVGNTSLDVSDIRHESVAVAGETRWMVAWNGTT